MKRLLHDPPLAIPNTFIIYSPLNQRVTQLQGAGGQCFPLAAQPSDYTSMYRYHVTACRTATAPGTVAPNIMFDSSSEAACRPRQGDARVPTCSGCTSVTGCVFSSDISTAPGRGRQGLCEPEVRPVSLIVCFIVTLVQGTGSLEFLYTSPSSCDSDGEINPGTRVRSVCRRLSSLEPTKT